MADRISQALDDVAFMRRMAEEAGARAPGGGAWLAAAGLIYGVASLAFYAAITGALPLARPWLVWLGAIFIYAIVGVALARRARAARRPAARGLTAVWRTLGLTVLVLFVAFTLASARAAMPAMMGMLGPVILALYGMAWLVAAALTGRRVFAAVGVAAFGFTLLLAWTVALPEQFLVFAAALGCTVMLPGLALARAGRG